MKEHDKLSWSSWMDYVERHEAEAMRNGKQPLRRKEKLNGTKNDGGTGLANDENRRRFNEADGTTRDSVRYMARDICCLIIFGCVVVLGRK